MRARGDFVVVAKKEDAANQADVIRLMGAYFLSPEFRSLLSDG
jgi:hypothetical protein